VIPVAVLTGFLGSGKTTLLGHLLRHPDFARTAVIINEFGEIGLDHELIEASDESFIELKTGCVCCTLRGDLVLTLADLLRRRDQGAIIPFERVVVETTGLADPAPILHALASDPLMAERTLLQGVIVTVDAQAGLGTLARHGEAVKQVAVADRLVLTKSDLGGADLPALRERLRQLNPAAPLQVALFGALDPASLLDIGPVDAAGRAADLTGWLAAEAVERLNHHRKGEITAFCITLDRPVRAVTLALFLELLAEHAGEDLLRVKGILDIVESPDRPAVIHGVQHVFHPPAFLPRWPSADHRGRIVCIVRSIPRRWIELLLAMLEDEVAVAEAARG